MRNRAPVLKITFEMVGLLAFLANACHADVMYTFTNFDGPNPGTNAGSGTNMNGIANTGAAVGFVIDNNGNFGNFVRNPDGTFTTLNINGSLAAMAFGINSAGDVVGTNGNGAAFFLPPGGPIARLTTPGTPSTAFGINDNGNIVGQYTSGLSMPGFFLGNSSGQNFITINAPGAPDLVNAQGVNDNGLIVGFYLGTDGQDHGFEANVQSAVGGQLAGTAIADPTIPNVPGEPGATFVFSQILGINDNGIAVGYYGDSTTSQHGFLYNTNTGQYTFLDDPSEQFSGGGVEVTQITGINNSGEITGFYSDANGVFHGFVANPALTPVPEPASLPLTGAGLLALWIVNKRRRRVAYGR
jgi:hypothetical protein